MSSGFAGGATLNPHFCMAVGLQVTPPTIKFYDWAQISDFVYCTLYTRSRPLKINKLPQIGDLPELDQRDRSPGSNSPPKIIKIAAMYNRLFGITDDGHILSITGVRSRAEIMNEHWTYVIILHIFFDILKLMMIIFTVQRGWYSKKRMGNACTELSMISSHQIIIILLTFK